MTRNPAPREGLLLALLAAGSAASVGWVAACHGAPTHTAAAPTATAAATSGPALLPAKDEAGVVAAANAFLATLSDAQRAAVQIDLTHPLAARWSNLPAGVVGRNGVFFRDLDAKQVAAALEVARRALSPEGFARFQEIRAADDAFAKVASKHGPGFGPPGDHSGGPPHDHGPGAPLPGAGPDGAHGDLFGAANYMIAFLGKPSTTAPWLLQLGGHHVAFNVYFKGAVEAATPYFVGVQPNVWTDDEGKTHAPLAPLRDAMVSLVHSLPPNQLARARLDARFDDVYVGPGRDGQFPVKSEGVLGSELAAPAKELLGRAIAAWTTDSVQGADYAKVYDAELDRTRVAFSGSPALEGHGDYVRIDGPHVWIEFACQGNDHYHTIWRDRTSDYGAEFTF